MCGIVGELRLDSAPADRDTVQRMVDAVAHRGPDGSGVVCLGPVGLGHARLAIVDLSSNGAQPMSNEDGTVWVVCNGEIYNHKELRRELTQAGHSFKSTSDSEVLVHLYEESGTHFVGRLRGMFAFAIWDRPNRRLMLARDRVGKKPLFYSVRPGVIRFASEMQALLRGGPFEPNLAAIHHYMIFQCVPGSMTAFRDVRRVPPAGVMTVDTSGAVSTERYWRLQYGEHIAVHSGEAIERILSLVDAATADRLMGDVPVGAFLSGGVDSGLVVSSMARQSAAPVHTFSIRFKEEAFDESPHARAVARMYGTDHHEFEVVPRAIEVLPDLIRHFGEPFADSSAIPTFYMAQMARRSIKVVLTGDGGDEAFGGYPRYVDWKKMQRLRRLVPRGMRLVLASTPQSRFSGSWAATLRRRIRRGMRFMGVDGLSYYLERSAYFPPGEKDELYTDEFATAIQGACTVDLLRDAWNAYPNMSDLDRLLCTDVENYLPDDLLVKVDITTMYHALEARAPLLDHRVLEYAARLPDSMKVRGSETKYILKQAALARLPREVVLRPKHGFSVPLSQWLRHDLLGYARDMLLDDSAVKRGYFKRESVRRLLDDHGSGLADNAGRIWILLCLETWHREVADCQSFR